jgi:hypothetical protein
VRRPRDGPTAPCLPTPASPWHPFSPVRAPADGVLRGTNSAETHEPAAESSLGAEFAASCGAVNPGCRASGARGLGDPARRRGPA